LAALAAGSLAAGGIFLAAHLRDSTSQSYRASAGVFLLVAVAVQLRLMRCGWRSGTLAQLRLDRRPLFWRWLAVGPVVCYLLALALGPDPAAFHVFVAALAAWKTLAFVPLALSPATRQRLARRLAVPAVTRLGRAAFLLSAALLVSEATVRLYAFVAGDSLPATYVARGRRLPPGELFRGREVNSQGYWDAEFQNKPRPGVFRIAALGDDALLAGSAESNYLAEIERSVPGIEIYNFGLPDAGPREYAAQLGHEVAACRPDLVLTFLSLGDDVTRQLPTPGAFDWRGLGLYQFAARLTAAPGMALDDACEVDRESYLRAAAGQLAVCRTPLDEAMLARWDESLAWLDRIARYCERNGIPQALVLLPGEFQVSPALCEGLCRNAGYERGQVDLDLPQRRLAAFANERELPLFDLLPHLRAAAEYPFERNGPRLNDGGQRLVAEALGDWLRRRYGTQVTAQAQASVP
jgi:hypothetical protein